jgi:hypothetical protein
LGIGRSAASRAGRLAPVDLAAGSPRKVRVRLRSTVRRALRPAGTVKLALRAHAVDATGQAAAPVRRAFTLRKRRA